jgi:hypothetical protein
VSEPQPIILAAKPKRTAKGIRKMWSLDDVAERLNSSTDHAARWLAKHNVERFDTGTGSQKRIRVEPEAVEAALRACRVSEPAAPAKGESYKPVYS